MVMQIGGKVLPDELLIEIGRFATIWTAIEQTIVVESIEWYNFKNRNNRVERLRVDFRRLREKWRKIFFEAIDEEFHAEFNEIDKRISNASLTRAYVLHGVWEETKEDVWGINGGKNYIVIWWEQRDKLSEKRTLSTNLDELQDKNTQLENLRKDLYNFLNKSTMRNPLPADFFE